MTHIKRRLTDLYLLLRSTYINKKKLLANDLKVADK